MFRSSVRHLFLILAVLVAWIALHASSYIPPSAHALNWNGSNSFTGVLTIRGGGLKIGSTANIISQSVRTQLQVDVANITTQTCVDSTVALTGAAVGDECVVGAPASPAAGVFFSCFVSATNTAKLRACNVTTADVNPAAAMYALRTFSSTDAAVPTPTNTPVPPTATPTP